jgi:hypothetical protein
MPAVIATASALPNMMRSATRPTGAPPNRPPSSPGVPRPTSVTTAGRAQPPHGAHSSCDALRGNLAREPADLITLDESRMP